MGNTAEFALETLVTLFGILLLAVVVLYSARRLGIGHTTGPLELIGRLPLEGRKAVYLTRVGNKVYALLASENALTKLDEIDPDLIPPSPPREHPLSRLLAKATHPRPSSGEPS